MNVLLELLREFFNYAWKPDDTVGTFVAGLKLIARKIESLNSDDFGNKFNEKLVMAKILGCLPKEFDSFVTSWSLLSNNETLDAFLEKLADAERSVTVRSDDVFKIQMKSLEESKKKPVNKKFQGKCHKCGKKGHIKKFCTSEALCENKVSQKDVSASTLTASPVLKVNTEDQIIADSGASVHLTRRLDWFSDLRKLDSPLILNIANGKTLEATHLGNISVEKSIDGKSWEKCLWTNVYYAEGMGNESLFSTTFMERTRGYSFYHGNGIMRLLDKTKTVLGGKRIGNQYIPFIRILLPALSVNAAQSIGLWHQRLGHVSDKIIRDMSKNELAEGLEVFFNQRDVCDSCHFGKQTNNVHPTREKRECLPGQRFHSDVCHVGVTSWNKCKYFLTVKDEACGYRRVFFLKTKDEVSSVLKQFFVDAERETGRAAVSLRTDNGTEYVNEKVREVLKSMNIVHEFSPPNVKQCNGVAERENRTLCDSARSMLFNTDLSKTDRLLLWPEAVGTAAHLRNRVPNRGLTKTTPYYEWYGKKPDVSHLRVFGAKAFVRIPDSMRRKMDPKARKGVFVGYDPLTDKVYRVFDTVKKIVERVSDVVIEDRIDADKQVLFPMPLEEQEEVAEQFPAEESISIDTENKSDEEEYHSMELDEELSPRKERNSIGSSLL